MLFVLLATSILLPLTTLFAIKCLILIPIAVIGGPVVLILPCVITFKILFIILIEFKEPAKDFFLKARSYSIDCAINAKDYVSSLFFNPKTSCSESHVVEIVERQDSALDGLVDSGSKNNQGRV